MHIYELMRFARVHRAWPILAGVVVVALLSAFLGGWRVPIPAIGGGVTTGIAFRRDLPMLSGVFLSSTCFSALDDYERIAAPRYFRFLVSSLLAVTAIACVFSFVIQGLAVGASVGATFVRSMLIWYGLALVSGRLFGWNLAWVLPVASTFPLIWLSHDDWWDWSSASATDPISWLLMVASLLIGAGIAAVTPWRLRSMNRMLAIVP